MPQVLAPKKMAKVRKRVVMSKVAMLGFWYKKMHIVLKPMKIQFSDLCNFYFRRNGRFCTQNSQKIDHKWQKMKPMKRNSDFYFFRNGKFYATRLKCVALSQLRLYRPTPSPPLSSEVVILTKKMCNVLKINMGVKFHIISYCVWALRASKRGVLGTYKFIFLNPNPYGGGPYGPPLWFLHRTHKTENSKSMWPLDF